ncbi:MAG: hypothetical protein M1828_001412 [Chrysothrix sp. TS-e1954]|nr:MAG: hypothetical protein M1828_001412 [Chrysothrix sp. TS-e1954]
MASNTAHKSNVVHDANPGHNQNFSDLPPPYEPHSPYVETSEPVLTHQPTADFELMRLLRGWMHSLMEAVGLRRLEVAVQAREDREQEQGLLTHDYAYDVFWRVSEATTAAYFPVEFERVRGTFDRVAVGICIWCQGIHSRSMVKHCERTMIRSHDEHSPTLLVLQPCVAFRWQCLHAIMQSHRCGLRDHVPIDVLRKCFRSRSVTVCVKARIKQDQLSIGIHAFTECTLAEAPIRWDFLPSCIHVRGRNIAEVYKLTLLAFERGIRCGSGTSSPVFYCEQCRSDHAFSITMRRGRLLFEMIHYLDAGRCEAQNEPQWTALTSDHDSSCTGEIVRMDQASSFGKLEDSEVYGSRAFSDVKLAAWKDEIMNFVMPRRGLERMPWTLVKRREEACSVT